MPRRWGSCVPRTQLAVAIYPTLTGTPILIGTLPDGGSRPIAAVDALAAARPCITGFPAPFECSI